MPNQTQHDEKKIKHHDQAGFIPGIKDGSTSAKRSMRHDTHKMVKSYDHYNQCRQMSTKFNIHLFKKKTNSQQVGLEGTSSNIIKCPCGKPSAHMPFNEKLRASPVRRGTRQGCPLTTSTQYSTGSPPSAIRQEKKKKASKLVRKKKIIIVCRQHDTTYRKP